MAYSLRSRVAPASVLVRALDPAAIIALAPGTGRLARLSPCGL